MKLFIAFIIGCSFAYSQEIQWASSVEAVSSEFNYTKSPEQYRAKEVLGAPSTVTVNKAIPSAWAPGTENGSSIEFIEVNFESPQFIQQVLVHETFNAGAVSKVIVKGVQGEEEVVFENGNPAPLSNARMLKVLCKRTKFKVASVRVEIAPDKVNGFNQIDAIGIADHQEPFEVKVNVNPTVEKLEIKPENLGEGINSKADDLSPVIAPNGNTLYFTRQDHPENIDSSKQDVWFSYKTESAFGKAEHMTAPINNAKNNSALAITPDGQRILLLNRYEADGTINPGISIARKTEVGWEMPVPVEIDSFYNNNDFGEYSLSNSGNIIVMTVEFEGTEGSKDLYVSFKKEDGSWTKPKSLGPTVNSAASEISPFLASDNRTLYFSSSGFPGYGGSDIFVTRRLDDSWQNWSEPENLGPFLNSPEFDAYYTLPANGAHVYFVSFREGGYGGADIYKAKLPEILKPKPVTLVKGVVKNQKTDEVLGTTIEYYSLANGKKVGEANSDQETGKYEIVLPSGVSYGFFAKMNGFLPVSNEFSLEKQDEYQEKEVNLYLVPIEKDAKITINNVYFDTDKFDLRPESFVELDQLTRILLDNSAIKVEIAGHTDDVGNNEHNMKLSENRAKSVVNYLISQGVPGDRLVAKGYGELNPVVENKDTQSRQKNRRVEFIIRSL